MLCVGVGEHPEPDVVVCPCVPGLVPPPRLGLVQPPSLSASTSSRSVSGDHF